MGFSLIKYKLQFTLVIIWLYALNQTPSTLYSAGSKTYSLSRSKHSAL